MSLQRNNAKKVSGEEVVAQSFAVKNSFVDPTGVNAVVLEGLTKDEIENFGEVVNVYPDLPVYSTAYSWGIDRIDQSSLPLSNTYTPVFKGCGVDITLSTLVSTPITWSSFHLQDRFVLLRISSIHTALYLRTRTTSDTEHTVQVK